MTGKSDANDPRGEVNAQAGQLLLNVYDPEVGLDIINMGLVYAIDYDEAKNTILIMMTLTSRGCPMGEMIMQNVHEVLESYFPDKAVHVELVWEPPWSPDMITTEGKEQLGWG